MKFMEKTIVERIGNWYNVKLDGVIYEVLIQKEDDHTIICDPSSIIVFDNDFNKVVDFSICDRIEGILRGVDWEYDTIEE